MIRAYVFIFLALLVATQLGCNSGTVEITGMTGAIVPVNMSSAGKVKVTVSSDTQVICYWADKELNSKFATGKFFSPQELNDAVDSHLIARNKSEFTETIDLPAGENFVRIEAFNGSGMNKYAVKYSIEKL